MKQTTILRARVREALQAPVGYNERADYLTGSLLAALPSIEDEEVRAFLALALIRASQYSDTQATQMAGATIGVPLCDKGQHILEACRCAETAAYLARVAEQKAAAPVEASTDAAA